MENRENSAEILKFLPNIFKIYVACATFTYDIIKTEVIIFYGKNKFFKKSAVIF